VEDSFVRLEGDEGRGVVALGTDLVAAGRMGEGECTSEEEEPRARSLVLGPSLSTIAAITASFQVYNLSCLFDKHPCQLRRYTTVKSRISSKIEI
jgi:hypothetical protein